MTKNAKSVYCLNGKLVPESQASVSVRDLGLTRGYAVFDFLITYHNQPFHLDDHLNRLFNSAKTIELIVPWSKEKVKNWVMKSLKQSDFHQESMIKIMLTGGESKNGITPDGKTNCLIIVDPRHKAPAKYYKQGAKLITVKHSRYLPQAKTNNYIEGVRQTVRAYSRQAIEPLYFSDKQVFECARSNIFALINGELLTPKTNILQGITRKVLLKILELEVPVKEKDFRLPELLKADEVFITGSNIEIMPIVRIDSKKIGDGKIGNITKEVMHQFREYTQHN